MLPRIVIFNDEGEVIRVGIVSRPSQGDLEAVLEPLKPLQSLIERLNNQSTVLS